MFLYFLLIFPLFHLFNFRFFLFFYFFYYFFTFFIIIPPDLHPRNFLKSGGRQTSERTVDRCHVPLRQTSEKEKRVKKRKACKNWCGLLPYCATDNCTGGK